MHYLYENMYMSVNKSASSPMSLTFSEEKHITVTYQKSKKLYLIYVYMQIFAFIS